VSLVVSVLLTKSDISDLYISIYFIMVVKLLVLIVKYYKTIQSTLVTLMLETANPSAFNVL